jgi:5-methylcytosine-specific restriction endonuclease McrA
LVGEKARQRNIKKGTWNKGKSYSIGKKEYKNKRWWGMKAKEHYGNACMKCGWDKAECDVHHKIPLSDGGRHTIENAIVLCPNCHRLEHSK